jgi:mono/diheme cytochrome c family protein
MKATPVQRTIDSPLLPATTHPGTGNYVLPAGFFIVVALLAYLGQAEGCYHHGLFSAGVYEPYVDLRSIPRAGGEVDPVEAGRGVYLAMGCSNCHQPNGSGSTMNNCPPLAKSDWVLAEGAGRLIRMVLHGGQGPIEVNGQVWSGGVMTPMGHLTDEQIAHVLTYVRQSPEWGNNAGPVTVENVAEVRAKTSGRNRPWNPAELMRIPVDQ